MKIEELSNHLIVTIIVAILGGESEHIDREDIAIKADELIPGKFNWRKYAHRIDLYTVRVALNDAKKNRNENLIVGDNQRGWMLSSNGLKWLLAIWKNEVIENLDLDTTVSRIFDLISTEQERLMSTNAYLLFKSGRKDEISKLDFYEFSRTNEYFKSKAKERRFLIIENAVLNHQDLSATWNYLLENF